MTIKHIIVTAIDTQAENEAGDNAQITYAPMPRPGGAEFPSLDYDDLERPVPVTVYTYPKRINVASIREWYPRKNNKQGTRIVFANGSAAIVKETFDEVTALIDSMYN